MGKASTVLVVAHSDRSSADAADALARRGYVPLVARLASRALELFRSQDIAATLILLPLRDTTAKPFVRALKEHDPSCTVILSGTDGDVKTPSDAFDLGAYDYIDDIAKDPSHVLAVIGGAIGSRRGDVQLRYLRQKDAPPAGWSGLVGRSPPLQKALGILRQVCHRTSTGGTPTILLTGETGTGKGFVAKCVHYNSARRNHAFIEVNCAALPPTLMEAELFGHERGAFTDAKTSRGGLFEAANGGTLFLDEIGTVPLDLQAKLLTAIEEKRVRRIGGHQSMHVDVQIIAATHEDLETRVKQGSFRSDLFHRLNVVAVELPALRERGDDAVVLAESFVASICREYAMPARRLTPDARTWITQYAWPGNVRELRNRIERVLLLENDEVIRAEHFGPAATPASTVQVNHGADGVHVTLPPGGVPFEELERAVLCTALAQCNGNVSRAARYLSISRQTLIYRMKKHRLDLKGDTRGANGHDKRAEEKHAKEGSDRRRAAAANESGPATERSKANVSGVSGSPSGVGSGSFGEPVRVR